jgi:hypothetical protein
MITQRFKDIYPEAKLLYGGDPAAIKSSQRCIFVLMLSTKAAPVVERASLQITKGGG